MVETGANKIGVLTPTFTLVASPEPPAFVAPNAPFGLTISAFYQSGVLDMVFNGNVSLTLPNANPTGAALGGTLAVAARDGVATFSGSTNDRAGTYRIMAFTDPNTTWSLPG